MSENKPDLMAELAEVPCADCGMPCKVDEYHPFAACLMFKACHNSQVVRANLQFVLDHGKEAHHAELEAVVRDAGLWRRHVASQGKDHSHLCWRCWLDYTPASGESEDCPACGFDGQDKAMHNSAREG